QTGHQLPQMLRGSGDAVLDRLVEPAQALLRVLYFAQVIEHHRVLRRMLEAHGLQPAAVDGAPGTSSLWRPHSPAEEKLLQAMPEPELVLLRRFSGSHQITQRLLRWVRHPHRREIASAIA